MRIPAGVTLYNIWSYTISQISQISQIKKVFDNDFSLRELGAFENENLRKYARIPDRVYRGKIFEKVIRLRDKKLA